MKYVVNVDGNDFPVFVDREEESFLVEFGGRRLTLDFKSSPGSSLHSLIVGGRQYEVVIESGDNNLVVYINGETHRVSVSQELKARAKKEDEARIEVKAAMPGLVVSVEVEPGQKVNKNDGLLVLEAMKMQNEVRTPQDGVVSDVHVNEGSPVEKGERLVTIQT